MPEYIKKVRFFEIGKEAPKGSNFKGIVSAETIFGSYGYFNYTHEQNEQQNAINKDEGSIFEYTSRYTSGNNRTMTNFGYLKTKEDIDNFKKIGLNRLEDTGRLVWEVVLSLKDLGIADKYDMVSQDDFSEVCKAVLPKFFEKVGLENKNMIWWEDYHSKPKNNKETHPHCHILFYEYTPSRTKGKFTKKQIDFLSSLMTNELIKRLNTISNGIDYKSFWNDVNVSRADIIGKITNYDLTKINDIHKLLSILPNDGRLQYNSVNMIPYREAIMNTIDVLLKDKEIKSVFDIYINKLSEYDDLKNKMTGDKKTSTTDREVKRLKIDIANYILSLKKDSIYNNKPTGPLKRVPDISVIDKDELKKFNKEFKEEGINEELYKKYEKIYDLLKKHESQLRPDDLYRMADMEDGGKGIDIDLNKALNHLERASELVKDQNIYKYLFYQRRLFFVLMKLDEKDRAIDVLKHNIDLNDIVSMRILAKTYIKKDNDADLKEAAIDLFKRSSALGDKESLRYIKRHDRISSNFRSSKKEIKKHISSMIYSNIHEIEKEIDEYLNGSSYGKGY